MGENYDNGKRIKGTTYWTYATIHRMLKNRMYAGHMEQGRNHRRTLHGKAKQLDRDQWIVVPDTHEPIIDTAQWDRVQALLGKDTRTIDFKQNLSPFAGFLRCGDCGRAMAKTTRSGKTSYSCGSYKRYGAGTCTSHYITHEVLEVLILDDLNAMIATVHNLADIAAKAASVDKPKRNLVSERDRIQIALERIYKLKRRSYEDYAEGVLSAADYARFKAEYDRQEGQLSAQLPRLDVENGDIPLLEQPWVKSLLSHRKLTELDRSVMAEMTEGIHIYEDGRIEIVYKFEIPEGLS